ncbi:MAG: hypothetical protein R3E66_19315, partial [bacterium]
MRAVLIGHVCSVLVVLAGCASEAVRRPRLVDVPVESKANQTLEFSGDIVELQTSDGITVRVENEGPITEFGPYGFPGLSFQRGVEPVEFTSGRGLFEVFGRSVLVQNTGIRDTPILRVTIMGQGESMAIPSVQDSVDAAVAEAKRRGLDFAGYSWTREASDNLNVVVMFPSNDDKVAQFVTFNRLTSDMVVEGVHLPDAKLSARQQALDTQSFDLDVTTTTASAKARDALRLLHAQFLQCVRTPWPEEVVVRFDEGFMRIEGFGERPPNAVYMCLKASTSELETALEDIRLRVSSTPTFVEAKNTGNVLPDGYIEPDNLSPYAFRFQAQTREFRWRF